MAKNRPIRFGGTGYGGYQLPPQRRMPHRCLRGASSHMHAPKVKR